MCNKFTSMTVLNDRMRIVAWHLMAFYLNTAFSAKNGNRTTTITTTATPTDLDGEFAATLKHNFAQ